MKKFLVFFVFLFGLACSAMAVPRDYKAPDGFICAKVDETINPSGQTVWTLKGQNSKIKMFFDTGSKTDIGLHSGCEDEYKKIYSLLLKQVQDIEQLVLIGSADEQNASGSFDNRDLAERRVNYAGDLFDGFNRHIYVTGDKDAETWSGSINNPIFRAVDIYVVWELQSCDQTTMNNVNTMQAALKEVLPKYADKSGKIKEALDITTKLQNICASTSTRLTASQGKEYSLLLSKLGRIMLELGKSITEIQLINNQLNISQTTVSNTEINAYYSRLNKIRDSLKVSAWRDAEGKFNTARLASDSIAGVVLGTVGGIVTSKLVKKNQLKKGFEDLSCNVGGQKVADYGDTFRVGLQ